MNPEDFLPKDLSLGEEESLRRLWDGLGRLPEEKPDPAMRQRFYRMLEGELESAPRRRPSAAGWRERLAALFPRPARIGVAWALPALVIGVLLGIRMPAPGRSGEVAELRQEVRSLSGAVTLSLLQQDSASDRLKGVSYGRSIGPTDERVLEALLAAATRDPDVNVRLAAVEALGGVAGRPGVQRTLVDSLSRQESPMVQIELIDLLADAPGARPMLSRVAADPDVDPTVRDYLRLRLERRV
jgi:hypothetical protein